MQQMEQFGAIFLALCFNLGGKTPSSQYGKIKIIVFKYRFMYREAGKVQEI